MKIEPQAGEFAATLALVNYALDPKAKAEVASAVRVTAIAGEARLTVNALDRVVAITCRATVAEPGEAAVRAAALAGIVANLPPDATVSIETIGAIVRVTSGSACYRLATIPVGDLRLCWCWAATRPASSSNRIRPIAGTGHEQPNARLMLMMSAHGVEFHVEPGGGRRPARRTRHAVPHDRLDHPHPFPFAQRRRPPGRSPARSHTFPST